MKYLIAFLSLIAFSCKNVAENKNAGNQWSEKEQQEFITSCMEQGRLQNLGDSLSKKYCDCMLEKFQSQFKSQQEATNVSLSEIAALSRGCVD